MNPAIMSAVEAERQFSSSSGGGSSQRRVKIDKVGAAWLVRFLPVRLGPSKMFYVRNAMHWLHKRPIACPRNLHPDFGGDPEYDCPVCAKSEELNDNHSEDISKFGYSIRANVQWITYCLCWEIDPGHGEIEAQPSGEVLKPWEFHMYKGTFDEFIDYYRRGSKKAEDSVLDLHKGNDFWATKTKKGVRLDKQDPTAIFEENDQFDALVAKVIGQVKEPRIKLPSADQLEVFAKKCEDAAFESAHQGGGRSTGRDERRGRRLVEEDEAEGNDDAEEAPVRSRTAARRVEQPARRVARVTEPAIRDEPTEEEQIEDSGDDGDLAPQPVPETVKAAATVRRPAATAPPRPAAAPPVVRPAAAQTTTAAAALPISRKLAPPPAASRPAPAAVSHEESTVDEEEDIAPESSDLAPPAEDGLPEAEQEEVAAEPAPAPRGGLRSSLKGRIAATSRR